MAISYETLGDLVANPSTLQRGVEYFRQGRVVLATGAKTAVHAAVRGHGHAYTVRLQFSAKQDDLDEYRCDCPAFQEYPGICKHIVATVLEYQSEYMHEDTAPGEDRASDREARAMLLRYAYHIADRASASREGEATLEPQLLLGEYGGPSLSFRVGAARLYVVQDLRKFKSSFTRNEVGHYGSKYTLWHNRAAFRAESRPIVNFFLKYYDDNNPLYAEGGLNRYYTATDKRQMYLSPRMKDELFALYADKELSVREGTQSYAVQVRIQDYRLPLSLTRKTGGFLLQSHEPFRVLRGESNIYLLATDNLYRCGEAYSAACGDLLYALASAGGKLFFSQTDVAALFSNVLSEADSFLHVDMEDDLREYKLPPLVVKVYLESGDEYNVFARVTFSYGENTHDAFREKNMAQSHDLAGEIRAEGILTQYFKRAMRGGVPVLSIVNDPDAVYRLVSEGLDEIAQFAEVYSSDEFNRIRIHPPATVSVGVRMNAGLLELDFDLEGLDLSELAEALASYRRAKKYHRLRNGSFLTLEDSAMSQLSDLADGLDLTDKQLNAGHAELVPSRSLYLDAMMKKSDGLRYDRDTAFKSIVRSMRDVSDADFEVPAPLRKVLRNYQRTGYRWLRTIACHGFGGILADDMGLGKTLQMLAVLSAAKQEGEHKPSIVICPASLVLNWESEAAKFTPDLRTAALSGTAPERAEVIRRVAEYDLLVTSYDQLKRDISLYAGQTFLYIIIDEAQYIKNHSTQNAKSVKRLLGGTRFALTGTPVENSLAELWSIFDFLMPGYLFSYHRFRKKYEVPIVKERSEDAIERLRQLVRPFLLRRLKKDVLKELPPKTETVLRSQMGAEQKKVYLATLAKTRQELAGRLAHSGEGQEHILVLAALTRLRQICCDPALLYENYTGGSVKLEACMELVQQCLDSGHRMLLFSQFTSMLDIIRTRLEGMGVEYMLIEGATKPSLRLDLVNSFNAGTTPVFLISLKAGGTGLNLTGADVVIHYDPWWNVSAQNQATDRAHRIGQRNKVQVYKLIVKDTLEERILKMQEAKARLADEIVQEGGNALESLSREELLSLFEDG